MNASVRNLLAMCFVFFSGVMQAGSGNIPSTFFRLGFGFTTYKSGVVKSNDTSNSSGYNIGIWGGNRNQVNMTIRSDSNETSFKYAKVETTSAVKTTIQDTILRYRLSSFYLGLVFTQMDFNVVKEGADYLDGLARGNGVNAGMEFFLGRGNSVFLDVTVASGSVLKELKQSGTDVSMGSRTDVFIGGKIRISRQMFDVVGGYRQRTYPLTVGGETFTELLTTTWFGCTFNFYL